MSDQSNVMTNQGSKLSSSALNTPSIRYKNIGNSNYCMINDM